MWSKPVITGQPHQSIIQLLVPNQRADNGEDSSFKMRLFFSAIRFSKVTVFSHANLDIILIEYTYIIKAAIIVFLCRNE